jgi:hypothetical protein
MPREREMFCKVRRYRSDSPSRRDHDWLATHPPKEPLAAEHDRFFPRGRSEAARLTRLPRGALGLRLRRRRPPACDPKTPDIGSRASRPFRNPEPLSGGECWRMGSGQLPPPIARRTAQSAVAAPTGGLRRARETAEKATSRGPVPVWAYRLVSTVRPRATPPPLNGACPR